MVVCLGSLFVKTIRKEFGNDKVGYYAMDVFNEMEPSKSDTEYLKVLCGRKSHTGECRPFKHSRKVQLLASISKFYFINVACLCGSYSSVSKILSTFHTTIQDCILGTFMTNIKPLCREFHMLSIVL